MKKEPLTKVDKFILWCKNNKVIALLIILGIVIIAAGEIFDAFSKAETYLKQHWGRANTSAIAPRTKPSSANERSNAPLSEGQIGALTEKKSEWPKEFVTRFGDPVGIEEWQIVVPPIATGQFTCNFVVRGALNVTYEGKPCSTFNKGLFTLPILQGHPAEISAMSGKYRVTLTKQPIMQRVPVVVGGITRDWNWRIPKDGDFTFQVVKL
jgi:hypothetical protein